MNKRKEKLRRFQSPRETGTMTGELHMARNGAGFLVDPRTNEATWIEREDLGTALVGDTVTIKVKPPRPSRGFRGGAHESGKSGPEGHIIRIDARAPRAIVGTLVSLGRFTRVQPLSPTYRQEFLVPDAAGAKVGDRVVMRFVRWDNPRLAPEGEITDVIGPADDPSLDTRAVMEQYDLPAEFPPEVLAEAERVGVDEASLEGRLDLRKKFIFTCDPESARDYDDALSLEVDRKGNRILGVHIADVSHFVTPKSALDREAYRRSTSVYLVDKVVPMLPEQLSNGVCSLVPHKDRLAFSTFLTFDAKGNCIARRFAKSVIRSKARYTYEQVMAAIAGTEPPAGKKAVLKANARKVVLGIHALAQQLRKNRFDQGALDMDVPEADIQVDAKGMMTGIVVRPYDESHQMIEECMVAANEAVAKELWTKGVKILARLHEAPDAEKLEELRGNLAKLGISCGDLSYQANLAKFLKRIKNTPLEGVLSVMVLRSMKRALYSAKEIGHFGLAKKFYAHFTSPIRRYPDLVLHRQLASWIAGEGGRLDLGWLNTAALHCSEREQNADDAERSLDEIKKFRFLQQVLDNPASGLDNCFEAVVSKCTRYGLFVDLPDLAVGGMVHVSLLSNSYVRWNDFNETLEGGGKVWKPGTKMNVRVEKIDFDRRLIDFAPVRPGRRS
ncbi:MAG: VacB/RNase II family 3'-5' exoribonuclease [Kiritimatiellae bacterium]|nr:VacB/RNase II family 3'-5' exoribonuclease [Kiritimatiellia bacterium]